MSGYGINSEMETKEALLRAGMDSDIVHINDLIAGRQRLSDYRLLVFPGGFSYGDDTGAGNAYANRVRNNLWDDLSSSLTAITWSLGSVTAFRSLQTSGLCPRLTKRIRVISRSCPTGAGGSSAGLSRSGRSPITSGRMAS